MEPHPISLQMRMALLGTRSYYIYIGFFGSIFSFEMARFLSSNDPEALLQLMEDIDSDFSDDDLDGFIDKNDENEKNEDCFHA